MIRAVELYHYEGMTQAAISERLGCTRWTVGRLLKEAEERGIVRVSIRHPQSRSHQLEQQLTRSFGLKDVRVVPTQPTIVENFTLVAQTAADYLYDIRPRPEIIGVGAGRTTAMIARALPDKWNSGVTVAQVSVNPREANEEYNEATVRVIAKRGSGTCRILNTPAIAKTVEQAVKLRQDPQISTHFKLIKDADVVVYAPDLVSEQSVFVRGGEQTVEEVKSLHSAGAVGTVLNHFVNADGNAVDEETDKRTMSLPLEHLRLTPTSVAVGYGVERHAAFSAIVAGKLANVLVTDSQMAESLLDNQPNRPIRAPQQ